MCAPVHISLIIVSLALKKSGFAEEISGNGCAMASYNIYSVVLLDE